MIKVSNLTKSFTVTEKEPGLSGSIKSLFRSKKITRYALDNVSCEISRGGIVGLVGPNGAGKTTLVKILAGIVHASSGQTSVLGFNPSERRNEFRQQIGLIMGQKAQLWWDLPATDSFLLLKEIYRIPDHDFNERLRELVEVLDVGHVLKTQLRRLSLGERMKMELIASLLHRPRVLFLDEPTIGLDTTSQQAIRGFLKAYVRKWDPIVILTSHYMDDIEELCERVLVIDHGKFIFDGLLTEMAQAFTSTKTVRVRPGSEQSFNQWGELATAVGAEMPVVEAGEVRFEVAKAKVGEFVAQLCRSVSVSDLVVEDVDIARVIQDIVKSGRVKQP